MSKLIFTHLLNDFSGSPKVLSQVIKAAKANEEDVELYTCADSQGFLSNVEVSQHTYFYKRTNNKWLTLITFSCSQLLLFSKLLKYWRSDVVIYVNTMLPFGAAFAGYIMGKPVIYHVHEISLTPKALKRFLRAIIQLTATKIIYVSKTVKVAESFKDKKTTVVYNALPKVFMDKAKHHSYNCNAGEPFEILMIASLKAYKGVNEFVALAQGLREHHKMNFTLVLNSSQQEIVEFFKNQDVPSNLILIPRQKNVAPFYAKAHVVLNLSHVDAWVETFGLTIIEAMAYGIPVIVPPIGGPSEIVRNGVEGYLTSAYDLETIEKQLLDIYQNPKLRATLSNNARKRAGDFSENVFNTEIIQSIHD